MVTQSAAEAAMLPTHPVEMSRGRILELDGLRTVAIILVIGSHYQAIASSLWRIPEFGWVGVEIFFVLSGYLITTILLGLKGKPGAYYAFYSRRARRILPPFFLTIAACAIVDGLATHRIDFRTILIYTFFLRSLLHAPQILAHTIASLRTGNLPSLFNFPVTPWNPLPGDRSAHLMGVLGPGWSLSVEEWFYVLWAPVVLAFRRRWIIGAIILSGVIGFTLRWLGSAGEIHWYGDFFCRLDMLTIGAALALWFHFRKTARDAIRIRGDRIVSCIGIVAGIQLALLLFLMRPILGHEIRDSIPFAACGMPLIGLSTAAIIAWLVRNRGGKNFLGRTLRSHPFVYIGRRSYTIYLVHLPWYWVVSAFLGFDLSLRRQWIAVAIACALTFLTAAVSWDLIESPLLNSKDTKSQAALVAKNI